MRHESDYDRADRVNEAYRRYVADERADLHGANDAPLRNPASVEWLARVTATSAVHEHLIATHDAARSAALEPYADELAVNWAFYDARVAGVTLAAARETNRRIDAATLPVAAAAAAREDARLAHLGRVWERYALARLRGKYMLTVGRVFGRAA